MRWAKCTYRPCGNTCGAILSASKTASTSSSASPGWSGTTVPQRWTARCGRTGARRKSRPRTPIRNWIASRRRARWARRSPSAPYTKPARSTRRKRARSCCRRWHCRWTSSAIRTHPGRGRQSGMIRSPTIRRMTMPEVLRGLGVAEAIEHLRRLNIVTRAEWDRLAQAQQRAAFTAAGVENRAALEALRKLVTEGLDKAWGSAQFETAATKLLAHFQTEAGSLRTLWNTVTAKSMAAGRAEMLKDPEVLRVVPYQMYDAFLDAVTRPNHRALDGAIAPAEWDGWNFYGPPNGFNCRCNLVSLTRREGERRLAAGGRFFDLRNGVPTVSAPPAGPDPGWTKFGEAASFADPERSNAQPRDLSSGVRRPAVKITGSAEPETVA